MEETEAPASRVGTELREVGAVKVAVVGCVSCPNHYPRCSWSHTDRSLQGHGTLNAIYSSVDEACHVQGWDGVDLLIIGGDFQVGKPQPASNDQYLIPGSGSEKSARSQRHCHASEV